MVPAFASKPHFLDGDPSLLKDVKGLHPDPAKHDIVVDVEPVSVACHLVACHLVRTTSVQYSLGTCPITQDLVTL